MNDVVNGMEMIFHNRTQSSTEKVMQSTDRKWLRETKLSVDAEIKEIHMAQRNRPRDRPYVRSIAEAMAQKRRKLGVLSQQIQCRLADLKQEHNRTFNVAFVSVCADVLSPSQFREIMIAARQKS